MIRLATADRPGLVCLQELPVWALDRIGSWSDMLSVGAVAERPALGPLPSIPEVGRRLTELHHGLFRSLFTGQANAVLVARELHILDREQLVLNPLRFRRRETRRLGLGLVARLAWGSERRLCQAVRVRREGGCTLLVGNLHATSYPPDRRLASAELLRAATFLDGLARKNEPVLFCGDFNVGVHSSPILLELTKPEWGFSSPGAGIDHVLVRGLPIEKPVRPWPEERRRLDGVLLSDHAPVEVTVA